MMKKNNSGSYTYCCSEESPSGWENGLHTDFVKQGVVNGYMGKDEKWSSVCEDGTYVNGGDVATENFFGI